LQATCIDASVIPLLEKRLNFCYMGLKRALAFGLFPMILAGFIVAGGGWAEERTPPFPSYGSGPVEVRLYTDFFCPPLPGNGTQC
jgi:hypothetical protein